MIGLIRGKIVEKQPPQLILDVSGVGYEIHASMNTFYKLPETGQEILLHTHFIVREDAQLLYGFFDKAERSLFRSLIKVNGVGPKLAISIMSSITPQDFVGCIMNNDSASLVRLPGIGKKTAERLIVEMRDRLDDWQTDFASLPVDTATNQKPMTTANKILQDAISALVALGYKAQEASRVVNSVYQEDLGSEQIIRLALKSAG